MVWLLAVMAFSPVLLGACTTVSGFTGDPTTRFINISEIEVSQLPSVKSSPGFKQHLKNGLHHYAGAYNRQFQHPEALPHRLEVMVNKLHYKGALQSALLIDLNSVSAIVRVVEVETGLVLRSFTTHYRDGASAMINGVVGAVMSATVPKEHVDKTLIRGLGRQIMNGAFALKEIPKQAKALLAQVNLTATPRVSLLPGGQMSHTRVQYLSNEIVASIPSSASTTMPGNFYGTAPLQLHQPALSRSPSPSVKASQPVAKIKLDNSRPKHKKPTRSTSKKRLISKKPPARPRMAYFESELRGTSSALYATNSQ